MFGVLFLDCDGVICTDRAYFASGQDKRKHVLRTFDPICIKLVNRLCDDFDLKVVITSTWKSRYDLGLILLTHGFTAEYHEDEKTVPRFSGSRGLEIQDWLDEHPEVKNFIIMDDAVNGLTKNNLSPFHCITHHYDGIRTDDYHEAVNILKQQQSGQLVYRTPEEWEKAEHE